MLLRDSFPTIGNHLPAIVLPDFVLLSMKISCIAISNNKRLFHVERKSALRYPIHACASRGGKSGLEVFHSVFSGTGGDEEDVVVLHGEVCVS